MWIIKRKNYNKEIFINRRILMKKIPMSRPNKESKIRLSWKKEKTLSIKLRDLKERIRKKGSSI